MTLRGATGEIRWGGYLPAVIFGPWRLETDGEAMLTGTVVSVDEYRVTQVPLSAVVQIGRQRLTYPVVDLQISGGIVTAMLGPRQE